MGHNSSGNSRKGNKGFIGGVIITILLVAALIGCIAFVRYYQNRPVYEDKNGWIHNAEGGNYDSDPYAGYNFARIECDKEEFANMTAHQFLDKLQPVFKAYKGKNYVTFDFGDGTGIYWPFASTTYDGVYGHIDEAGVYIDTITLIHVEGNQIVATDGSPFDSLASINMYDYLPEAYYNDSSFVMVNEDLLFISVVFDNSTLPYDEASMELWNAFQEADLTGINHVVICMNGSIYYVVNEEGIPVYDETAYDTYFDLIFGEGVQ